MPIRCYSLWGVADNLECLLEKPLGCLHISFFTEHGIDQPAILVDSSMQIPPLPMHFQVGFVNIPGAPRLPEPLASQLLRYQWGKSCFPITNGLVRKDEITR